MYLKVFFGLITIAIVIGFTSALLNFPAFKVARQGKVVQMEIIKLSPRPLTTKANAFVHLKYNEQVFSKKIGKSFYDEHAVGDIVYMRYLEGETLALYPKDNGMVDFISLVLVGMFFMFSLGFIWVKFIR